MDINVPDLRKLLTMLEAELEAREIVISILKTERVKSLLNPCFLKKKFLIESRSTDTIVQNNRIKKNSENTSDNVSTESHPSDPFLALFRDACNAYDPSFNEIDTKLIFSLQYKHLCDLIDKQKKLRKYLENQLSVIDLNYKRCFQELEVERKRNVEFDREKVIKMVEDLTKEKNTLTNDIENIRIEFEKEKEREKEMIMCLVDERNQLIVKLIEEKEKNMELMQLLNNEKNRVAEVVEGLEEESKRSLQMESDLEKLTADFEDQKQKLKDKILSSESEIVKLKLENDKLKEEIESMKNAKISSLGEGVRSTIVTINSYEHKIVPSVTSMAAISIAKVGHAQPVNRPVSSTYATVQPKNNTSTTNTNTTPPLPSSLPPTSKSSFHNMTYSIEPVKLKSIPSITSNTSASVSSTAAASITTIAPSLSSTGMNKVNTVQRGAPPPIPPNKPVIPPSALKEKSKEIQGRAKIKGTGVPIEMDIGNVD